MYVALGRRQAYEIIDVESDEPFSLEQFHQAQVARRDAVRKCVA